MRTRAYPKRSRKESHGTGAGCLSTHRGTVHAILAMATSFTLRYFNNCMDMIKGCWVER
jgi:hypothetical protein